MIHGLTHQIIGLDLTPTDNTYLITFGCLYYAWVNNGKLEPRAVKWVFIWYNPSVQWNKLWSFDLKNFIISREVTSYEVGMIQLIIDSSKSTYESDALSEVRKEKDKIKVECPTSPSTYILSLI